jgi:hypothetical protein
MNLSHSTGLRSGLRRRPFDHPVLDTHGGDELRYLRSAMGLPAAIRSGFVSFDPPTQTP